MNEETVVDRIRQRLAATGKTPHGASVEAGSPSLIPNILNGRSRSPRIDTLNRIAPILGTTGEWLMSGTLPASDAPRPSEVRRAENLPPQIGSLPKDVPVLGTVAGSELGNGAFQLTSDIVDYVRRPYGLLGAADIYALYVEGESMMPRFEPGELVYVHPHRKARNGDYVVVQEPDTDRGEPRGFIKRLLAITGTLIRTEQFNPPAGIDFVIRPGVTIHKVMSPGEMYGV